MHYKKCGCFLQTCCISLSPVVWNCSLLIVIRCVPLLHITSFAGPIHPQLSSLHTKLSKTGDGEGLGVRLVVHGHLFTVLVMQWYCTLHVDWMWTIGCPIVYGQRLQYHSHSNLWNVTIRNVDWMWPIGCPIVYGGDYNIQRNKCSQAAE